MMWDIEERILSLNDSEGRQDGIYFKNAEEGKRAEHVQRRGVGFTSDELHTFEDAKTALDNCTFVLNNCKKLLDEAEEMQQKQ